jgi:membrane protease YdiL (CAAX protease family)
VWVYGLVCIAVFFVTRLQDLPIVGRFTHLGVAAVFLLTAVALTRGEPAHYGMALGGLLEPSEDDRSPGPLGLFDLARALTRATPSALRELGVALAIATVVFPLYAVGFAWWVEPSGTPSPSLPPNVIDLALTQLLVVALPEEAFFRGYLQTSLTDSTTHWRRVLGVPLDIRAWLLQAALFAAIHFLVEPHPARLAVFFPGLLFGWLRAWRGGIGAATALHALSNLYSEILARSWL